MKGSLALFWRKLSMLSPRLSVVEIVGMCGELTLDGVAGLGLVELGFSEVSKICDLSLLSIEGCDVS